MKDTTLKIAFAGLIHDIGKFTQGFLSVSQEYKDANAQLYQPFRNGHFTHVHATYTAAFIEQMAHCLPRRLNAPGWGEGDAFLNLAAGHHNPDTPMQWIITAADRISSGLDRTTFENGTDIAIRDYQRTRLLPVLEALGPGQCQQFRSSNDFKYEYPLHPLSADSIFPKERGARSREDAKREYKELFDGFIKDLERLHHKELDMELWCSHFDSLMQAYTSCIPAARVGDVVYDVSLYDHCRTTAAIAAALYQYHAMTGTLEEKAIRDDKGEKFLLVGGDFYGIQSFIFSMHGDTRRFRSKLLRGRSFAVSLFSELAARLICERLKLPFLSVMLNAAGKFHLLAPNTPKAIEALEECRAEINKWLFERTYGENSIGISWTPARQADFKSENGAFRRLWDRHLRNIEASKFGKIDLERYGGAVAGYLDSFDNELGICQLCGKRPAVEDTAGDPVFMPDQIRACRMCRDHVYLGKNLVSGKVMAICSKDGTSNDGNHLLDPIFGKYQLMFRGDDAGPIARQGHLLGLWSVSVNEDGTIPVGATVKLMNGHVPRFSQGDDYNDRLLKSAKSEEKRDEMAFQIKEGAIKTFEHIAFRARRIEQDGSCRGVEALGVLKADVDNLGMLFGCGLSDDRFTISRLATMSRQLNSFFSLYLPYLLHTDGDFNDVYTVFAGGDDLFLIGPWNKMARLASRIDREFSRFVCGNPHITISAGITVHRPNTPVDAMSEAAEEALSLSKAGGRKRVTMFGTTVEWKDFHELLELQPIMEHWRDKKYISDVMLYRLNYLIDMADKEEELNKREAVNMEDMECLKWPALFRYSVARNVTNDKALRKKALEEMEQAFQWLKSYRGAVRIPLWHLLYEKRS